MKSSFKNLILTSLTLFAILGGVVQSHSQTITVKVDSTKNWTGYMNWFSTSDNYIGGNSWGIADLRGAFIPNKATATNVVLQINTNTYNTGGFWNLADGTPNKHLEANFYVDVGTTFGGNDVTFEGTVLSNSLPAGWTCQAVIKQFGGGYSYVGDTRADLIEGSPFTLTRTIPPGNICQYGFLLYGPNTPPGSAASLTQVRILVDNADPAVTAEPANQRAVIGGTASFTVAASGGSTLHYQWQRYDTNLLNSVKFSGATSSTLTISNAQSADATAYTVIVSDNAGSVTNTAQLLVLTPAEFANALDNPSFELNVTAPGAVPRPWVNFSGSALVNTNDNYAFTPGYPIQTIEGTNAVKVFNSGEYNGFFQDAPAAPGQIFTGDGWFYMSSQDLLLGTCEAFLEVQFRQGNNNPIAIYQSSKIDPSSPTDTWLFYQATNGVPAGYSAITTTNAFYLVAPAGTDHVRYQLTLHNISFGGSGNVYLDAATLMKKIPASVSTAKSGGNVTISWLTQGATSYQVVYKDNLTDTTWTPIGLAVAGDGTTKSVSYSATTGKRFYAVLTQ